MHRDALKMSKRLKPSNDNYAGISLSYLFSWNLSKKFCCNNLSLLKMGNKQTQFDICNSTVSTIRRFETTWNKCCSNCLHSLKPNTVVA